MTTADQTMKAAIDEAIGPLIADHRRYLADVNGPLLPVSRAQLHYVYDQYNTELLDFSGKLQPVGHNHPFVVTAIREHLDYYIRTTNLVNDHILRWPVEYAAKIVESFTEEDQEPKHKVLWTEGEREAVLTAINLGRQATGKFKVAIVDTGTHGWVNAYQPGDKDLLRIAVDDPWLKDFRWEQVSAVLLSLVTENGHLLSPSWVQELVDYAKQNSVAVIIDESLTGLGRLGTMWGQQNYSVDADLTALGGPVGGGLALGAVVASKPWFDGLSTFVSPQAGSPVACAAGAATMRAINPGVLEHVKEASESMREWMSTLDQFAEYITGFEGSGLWVTIDFTRPSWARQFELDTRSHGLLVPEPVGSSVTLTPPLIASEQEIKRGVDLIADTLLDWGDEFA